MKKKTLKRKYLEDFRYDLLIQEKGHATIEKYIRDISRFYEFVGNQKVNKELVLAYKDYLQKDYKITSVNSMLVALNQFFIFLNWQEYKVKVIKVQKSAFIPEEKELTKEEYYRLVKVSQDKKNMKLSLLIQTISTTGIRVSEHQYITVEALKAGHAQINNKGKIRDIFLPKKLQKVLLNYCRQNKIGSGPVFTTRTGKPINRSNIWKSLKLLAQEARVNPTKVFPHNLRHFFALCYYKVDKDIVRLADILGHSCIETTRIYVMTSIRECQRKLNKIELLTLRN